MIIIDLNQVILSTLFMSQDKKNLEVDEDIFRHITLNTIRSINVKFRAEYGNLVIADDSTNTWRKQFFPYYKASRKKSRDKSSVDWSKLFESMDVIKQELKQFPYKYLKIEETEADDIIGVLCNHIRDEKILIVSGDKDFKQLQIHDNVSQYDTVGKRWLVENDPVTFLKEHIIMGDRGDGIPNILSDDNTFVMNKRQKPLTKKRLDTLLKTDQSNHPNFIRNKTLIDLNETPQHLVDKILDRYRNETIGDRSNLMPFFMKHRLKLLMEKIGDF